MITQKNSWVVVLCGVIVVGAVALGAAGAPAQPVAAIQPVQDIPVIPEALQRISWPAVFAGTLIALVTELAFYVAGLTLGVAIADPRTDDGPSPRGATAAAVLWTTISTLIALFIGGWMAAHFAGIPTILDGVLHGLVTWALLTVLTVAGLSFGAGRIISGTGSLISNALSAIGSAANTATTGISQMANAMSGPQQPTIRLETNGSAPSVAQQVAVSLAAAAAGNLAPDARQRLEEEYHKAIDNMPEVENARDIRDMTLETIEEEARTLAAAVGVSPQQVSQQAGEQMSDIRNTVSEATRHPDEAAHMLRLAVNRLLRRADEVTSDVDRDSAVGLLQEYTDMNENEARETVNNWENAYRTAVDELEQARERAWSKIQEARAEAEARINEMREEAEERAQRAAARASNTVARLGAGVLLAMVIGALAAGVGGSIGSPDTLPEVEIPTSETW